MNVTVDQALPLLAIDPSIARLSLIDGSKAYEFICNPESVDWSHTASFSSLPVLGTAQPLVAYQQSASTLELPNVKFWTRTNSRDLTVPLATLTAWTKPATASLEPPLLKLTWGRLSVPRCYLASFSYEIVQFRSGAPTQAAGSMSLLLAPERPAAVLEELADGELTARQREEYTAQLAELYPDKTTSIDANGDVIVDGSNVGSAVAIFASS